MKTDELFAKVKTMNASNTSENSQSSNDAFTLISRFNNREQNNQRKNKRNNKFYLKNNTHFNYNFKLNSNENEIDYIYYI